MPKEVKRTETADDEKVNYVSRIQQYAHNGNIDVEELSKDISVDRFDVEESEYEVKCDTMPEYLEVSAQEGTNYQYAKNADTLMKLRLLFKKAKDYKELQDSIRSDIVCCKDTLGESEFNKMLDIYSRGYDKVILDVIRILST